MKRNNSNLWGAIFVLMGYAVLFDLASLGLLTIGLPFFLFIQPLLYLQFVTIAIIVLYFYQNGKKPTTHKNKS